MLSKKLQEAAGNAGAGAYIEDVFSTYLYTGTGTTQTVNTGLDYTGDGGLLWIKNRDSSSTHCLVDTARGAATVYRELATNSDAAQNSAASFGVTALGANGFSLSGARGDNNSSTVNYTSWGFLKAENFFDIVTYTGTGANRTVAHNLGSVPGCIIVKRTDDAANWQVYHRSLTNTEYMVLNLTDAKATGTTRWNSTTATSSVFSLGTDATVNASGGTYVAYLFAHNAGGFGAGGSEDAISCGSYTGNGSTTGPVVTLGYEPQWVIIKRVDSVGDWNLYDVIRGWTASGSSATLKPNSSSQELTYTRVAPNATGFQPVDIDGDVNASGGTYIYIAIRRGPMKTPESGTEVFSPVAYAGTGSATTTATGFVTDLAVIKSRGTYSPSLEDRLRGANRVLESNSTGAEITTTQYVLGFDTQNGVRIGTDPGVNGSGTNYINWAFRRAPGFMDVVCYSGDSVSGRYIDHNLSAVPELIIVKCRNSVEPWIVGSKTINNGSGPFIGGILYLNTNAGETALSRFPSSPTATTFRVSNQSDINQTGNTYVAYLFATIAGVSKVGSYTGTGTTLQINCGFAAGARFVLIKRTDTTGDWYVWDTARGISAGNDPYLLLNSTAAEVTSTDYIDPYAAGFEISSTAPAAINANGGTYIYLAIA